MTRGATIATFGLLCISLSVGAQSGPQVVLPLIATDSQGHSISGLSSDSITVFDHKSRVNAKLVRGGDLPLRLGIVIDTSTSEEKNSGFLPGVHLAQDFVSQIIHSEQDRVFFELFDAVPRTTGLLSKHELSDLDLPQHAFGGTGFYDAVVVACRKMGEREPQTPVRRVLVILSDGDDTMSHVTLDHAVEVILQSGVTIFSINTSSGPHTKGDRNLKLMSEAGGGLAFLGVNRHELPDVFVTIRDQIEGMYYLSFTPADIGSKKGVHKLDVQLPGNARVRVGQYLWNP